MPRKAGVNKFLLERNGRAKIRPWKSNSPDGKESRVNQFLQGLEIHFPRTQDFHGPALLFFVPLLVSFLTHRFSFEKESKRKEEMCEGNEVGHRKDRQAGRPKTISRLLSSSFYHSFSFKRKKRKRVKGRMQAGNESFAGTRIKIWKMTIRVWVFSLTTKILDSLSHLSEGSSLAKLFYLEPSERWKRSSRDFFLPQVM